MRFTSVPVTLVTLLAGSSNAQYLINELSFGYSGRFVTLGLLFPSQNR